MDIKEYYPGAPGTNPLALLKSLAVTPGGLSFASETVVEGGNIACYDCIVCEGRQATEEFTSIDPVKLGTITSQLRPRIISLNSWKTPTLAASSSMLNSCFTTLAASAVKFSPLVKSLYNTHLTNPIKLD